MSFGDTLEGVKVGAQDIISGSRIYGVNKRTMNFSSSSSLNYLENHILLLLENVDLDNFVH